MLSLETKFMLKTKFSRAYSRTYKLTCAFRLASPKSTAQILTAKTSNRHDLL